MSTENKLIKTAMEATVIVGIASGLGFISKKLLKESFLNDPSTSLTNYGKWVLVLAGSLYLREYLIDQKIIPKSLQTVIKRKNDRLIYKWLVLS